MGWPVVDLSEGLVTARAAHELRVHAEELIVHLQRQAEERVQ